jgi:hypothetical protein
MLKSPLELPHLELLYHQILIILLLPQVRIKAAPSQVLMHTKAASWIDFSANIDGSVDFTADVSVGANYRSVFAKISDPPILETGDVGFG